MFWASNRIRWRARPAPGAGIPVLLYCVCNGLNRLAMDVVFCQLGYVRPMKTNYIAVCTLLLSPFFFFFLYLLPLRALSLGWILAIIPSFVMRWSIFSSRASKLFMFALHSLRTSFASLGLGGAVNLGIPRSFSGWRAARGSSLSHLHPGQGRPWGGPCGPYRFLFHVTVITSWH